jgi:hypothetical protein
MRAAPGISRGSYLAKLTFLSTVFQYILVSRFAHWNVLVNAYFIYRRAPLDQWETDMQLRERGSEVAGWAGGAHLVDHDREPLAVLVHEAEDLVALADLSA